MVKKLRQKNKEFRFLIGMVGLFTFAFLAAYVLYPYLNLYLVSNIFSFLSSTTSTHIHSPFQRYGSSTAYGENIDMSQILPASQHYVVNSKGQDLIDIAGDLGINLVRITNAKRSFHNNEDSVYTKDQWDQVLNKMQSKGMKAIILIEVASNNGDYFTPDIRSAYLHLVQEYIDSGVFSHPDVYAVDLKNEPILTDANITMLQAAHAMIKEKYPDLKQTIGWWATPQSTEDPYSSGSYNWTDFSAGQKIASLIDFYSVHMYGLSTDNFGIHLGPDLKTKVFLSRVENGLQTKKPILIEEFGEANGDAVSDQDTIGSPQLQANVYQGVYQALKEMHNSQIIGAVAFDFYSRDYYPDAWAIVKNNGDYLFPAAYILQEYALGESNPSLQAATIVHSQSYLLKNVDNHTLKNLYIADRIGLKLQFDDSKHYSLSLNTNGILQLTEGFHYNPVMDSYYAVYQAINKGTVQLNIFSSSTCSTNNVCASPLYTVTINIQ